MIKDKVKELIRNSYEEFKGTQFNSKEEFWGMLTAETQRAVQDINDYARCNDQIFEACIKGAIPINQCTNNSGANITDIMLEKAERGIEKLVKCSILLKRYKDPGIMEVKDVLNKEGK